MKPRILAASIALLLTPAAFAITDTWDGGAGDNNFSTGTNWADNSAPVSDLANTDLIFAGVVRLSPVLGSAFSAKSVVFNNTAGDFTFSAVSPVLTVGSGGISNVDLASQTFGPVVAAANQTISSGNGSLTFNGGLSIAPGVNVALGGGGPITIAHFQSGTGTLTKGNAGNLLVRSSATPILADLNLTAGVTLLTPVGGTQTLGSTGSIAVGSAATFNINESLTLIGGAQLTRVFGGLVNIASGKTLRLESGSDFVVSDGHTISAGNVTVTGAGSTFQSDSTVLTNGAALTVLSGGSVNSGLYLDVGTIGSGTLTGDGVGSAASGVGIESYWGSGGGASASVSFSNNASGAFSDLEIGRSGGSGNVQILSGADLSNLDTLTVGGTTGAGGSGLLLVSGAGTTWQNSGAVSIGAAAVGVSTGVLTVGTGALFTASSTLTIRTTGTVNLDGGTLAVSGALTKNGTLNFTSGALSITESWSVGAAGLLGANVTFDGARRFTTTGTTTIDALNTLTLNGGTLTTSALVNTGAVAFNSGTLAITGAGGFSTNSLGANVTLGTGANLQVTNAATVASGKSLIVDGGSVAAGALINGGLVEHVRGTLTIAGAVTNQTGADFFAAKPLTVGGVFTNQSGAHLTLQNGTGRVNGAGSISNAGLIGGDGTLAVAVTNTATGDIRAESGKTLYFTGGFTANAGDLILQGGTLDFSTAITNSATGFISGRGALHTNGLTNNGVLAFSGGNTDIRGDVVNSASARIVTSGAGATTTFFDDVAHNGLEIFTGAGASTVFFGAQSGAGNFTGTGTVYFIGDLRPGNSPAAVSYEGDLVFGGASSLTLEIGGLMSGSEHDHLAVGGTLHADGVLAIELLGGFLPELGDTFDLFDAGTFAGGFDAIAAPALPGNLAWDFAALKRTGTVGVVPEPSAALLIVLGTTALGLIRRRRALFPR